MSDALERARRLVEQYPENEMARFSLGKVLYDAGDWVAAKEQFSFALARKPGWMVVQILVGKCDVQLGDRTAARVAFEKALQLAIDQKHEGPEAEMRDLLAGL